MFDSIISEASSKFGLGNKAGALLAALLGLMTDQNQGGFVGFLDRFRSAGLGDAVTSWITTGENTPLSVTQVESALGKSAISDIASRAGVNASSATSALGYMIPNVVDRLTPDGEIPDERSLLSKIGDFLSGIGGAVAGGIGAAGAVAAGTADRIGDAAAGAYDSTKRTANKVGDKAAATFNRVDDAIDGDSGSSILKWLIPLILLGILIALGWAFCRKADVTPVVTNVNSNANTKVVTNGNTNAAAKVESSLSITAKDGKYTVSGIVPDQKTLDDIKAKLDAQFGAGNVDYSGLKVDPNAKPFGTGWWDNFVKLLPNLKDWKNGTLAFAGSAITTAAGLPQAALDQLKSLFTGWTLPAAINGAEATNADRKLTEVSLPSGTKLQAYPGGIEDQLIKFIQSDEYKNGTADSLKDKWFNFDDLNFKFGTTELVPESKRQLDNIVAILKAFPDVKIKIGGYTDKKGDDAANLKLSDGRAKAVKAALDKAGVGAQVPEAEGYGEKFATVAETASDKEREADRKTSIRLLK